MKRQMPGFRDAIRNHSFEFRAEGQHSPQNFTERRQVVVSDPFAEAHQ